MIASFMVLRTLSSASNGCEHRTMARARTIRSNILSSIGHQTVKSLKKYLDPVGIKINIVIPRGVRGVKQRTEKRGRSYNKLNYTQYLTAPRLSLIHISEPTRRT